MAGFHIINSWRNRRGIDVAHDVMCITGKLFTNYTSTYINVIVSIDHNVGHRPPCLKKALLAV